MREIFTIALCLGLFGCASSSDRSETVREIGDKGSRASLTEEIYLFQASAAIQDEWTHLAFQGATDYRLAIFDDEIAIRAEGRKSASGLIRHVDLDPNLCPEIEWAWSVSALQESANLHHRDGEDVGASLFILFGDPGFGSAPNPVPTLRYVWSAELAGGGHGESEEVIDSPYMPGVVKSIVVERGLPDQQSWVQERRNIREDFERAFGRLPDGPVQAIALFSDNDQTGEPVEAYYGWARAHCKPGTDVGDAYRSE